MILDTTFLIDFFRGNLEAVKKIEEMESADEAIFTTSVSVFEVVQGIKGNKERLSAKEFFSSIGVFALTKKSAVTAGEIRSGLKKSGLTIDPEDAMIAGIAIVKGQAVLTRNKKHFSQITNLLVETY